MTAVFLWGVLWKGASYRGVLTTMIAGAPEQLRSADDLRPWIEAAIESFGWDRVLFGGDWPVCLLGSTLVNWPTF